MTSKTSSTTIPPYLEEVAKVSGTHLGYEDHGIFSATVSFDFGGAGQSFGPYCLDGEYTKPVIEAVMRAFGVSCWEDIKGKMAYVLRYDEGNPSDRYGLIRGIKPLAFNSGKGFIFHPTTGEIIDL